MDDKLIILTNNRITVITGTPPNALGAEDSLSSPQIIPSQVGSKTRWVADMPAGIVFQAQSGIWMLDRGLNPSYIGAAVEDMAGTLTGVVTLPEEQSILLASDTGVLVYDYFYNIWSQYTLPAIGSCLYTNSHALLSAAGEVRLQGQTYGDAGAPYSTVIDTGWLSLAGVNGYQRVLNVMFLGAHKGPCKFVIDVMYDFSDTIVDTYQFDTNSLQSSTFGAESPYGTGTFGGDTDGVFRLKLKPSRQKCSAIKFRIRDEFPESAPTAGFSITQVSIEAGVIAGRARMGTGNNIIVR
jgi:hypothetical protein